MSSSLQSSSLITFAPNNSSRGHSYMHGRSSLSPSLCKWKNNGITIISVNSPPEKNTKDMIARAYKDIDGGDATVTAPEELHGGIGIVKYLHGKNYFITGATGFLAKVFIEKLLRTEPGVGKIFILIKAKDKEAAAERLKVEIIDSELFKYLKILHGKSYKAFMLSKLIPVVGNVCESNLGIETNLANQITEAVNVIVNSSANTTFDERYDVAINTNTLGPCRLLSFAKKCMNLSIFLHVSTAYVNGKRGIIIERPLHLGQITTMENVAAESREVAITELNLEAEINIALQSKEAFQTTAMQKMKELGLERAKRHGWQDTYSFTKAMGEMMINSQREKIPVVVIRPSVIESAYREPFSGWIQGNRMLDPLILSYGKGHLPGMLANPRAVIDIVPVDMVVNTALAAMARHGTEAKPDLNVYHAASSVSNPILLHDLFKYSCDHFKSSPLKDTEGKQIGITNMKFFSSMDDFSSYI